MKNLLKNKNAAAIRILASDTVQLANSGHPGAPMGMADLAEVLWRHHLKHNPNDPNWLNRDRFVLSNGHASMLVYALLHLSGYDLSMEDIKEFRQLHSKTPGHPEYKVTPGVETTTGPLGQGISNAVGMALAEKLLADEFNQIDYDVIDHYTYVFAGDGCLMEGISHEVCSFAGTLGLGKLIVIYDDNGISIDGDVKDWFADNTTMRFEAYGWQVFSIDGHDSQAINEVINEAKKNHNQPSLIRAKTIIGAGSPNKAGGHDVHGAPLGDKEIVELRKALNWELPPFEIPNDVYEAWDCKEKGNVLQAKWQNLFNDYAIKYPEKAKELKRRNRGELSSNWMIQARGIMEEIALNQTKAATRKSSQIAIEKLAKITPEFLGGSADLTSSNLTNWPNCVPVRANKKGGQHINYGVREFGMAAIMNGITLHGGFIPFGGTFLTFCDYSRNAIRMAALMGIRVIHVFTHDSIGLGEDGPTHQAIEQVASLRLIPNLNVWRPADSLETIVAWVLAIRKKTTPSALILTRQALEVVDLDLLRIEKIMKGAYQVNQVEKPKIQILATGSELEIVMQAQKILDEENIKVKIISVPCLEVFLNQDDDYKKATINKNIPTIAIEAGIGTNWYQIMGAKSDVICMKTFGESAPANELYDYFGITVANLVKKSKALLMV